MNIQQAKDNLQLVKQHVQTATKLCNGIKNQSWYGTTDCVPFKLYTDNRLKYLDQLKNILADFTTPESELYENYSQSNRQKRGVLNFVGQISKILFGTLDENDATYYTDKISKLEADQRNFLQISKDQMIVVKSTIASFNFTFREVQRNEKLLQAGLMKVAEHVDKIMYQFSNETHILMLTQAIAEHSMQIQRAMNDCENTFNIILDALVHAQDGVLQPQIITPNQVRKIMRKEPLPAGLNYPVPLTDVPLSHVPLTDIPLSHVPLTDIPLSHVPLTDIPLMNDHSMKYHIMSDSQSLMKLIKPNIFLHRSYLVYVLNIPLTTSTRYQLYQVIPFPKRFNGTTSKYIYLEPSREFILSEPTRQTFAKLTRRNVEDCQHVEETRMICKQDFPIINFQENEDCEASLLHPATAAIPASCKARVIELKNTLWLKLHGNAWIHVSPRPELISFMCTGDTTPQSVTLNNQGIVRLEPGCKGYGTHATTMAYSTITKNVTFPDVIPISPIDYDCCLTSEKQQILENLELHIPLSNVLSNTDELQLTSHTIDMINERIDQEEEKLKQKQGFRYLSWTTYTFVLLLASILMCMLSYCCCKCCRTCTHSIWKYWKDSPGCTELVRHCTIKQRIHTGPVYYQGGAIPLPEGASRQIPTRQSPVVFTELVSPAVCGRNKPITELDPEEEDVPLQHRLRDSKRRSWR